jgi:hypothetical protein
MGASSVASAEETLRYGLYGDGVDGAPTASGSIKSCAKMVVVEQAISKEHRPWRSLSSICLLSRQLGRYGGMIHNSQLNHSGLHDVLNKDIE